MKEETPVEIRTAFHNYQFDSRIKSYDGGILRWMILFIAHCMAKKIEVGDCFEIAMVAEGMAP
ncbi:hypothetical protein [Veillonella magna]|uniref:hypothetical protein n=1 Tax=Veillonella magna TaxID=464322 RepID=UPI0023F5169F|nr:hypothetical protein [Veillonella magna]MBD8975905.1 hypothetical protein [Veillonella magna]